MLSDPLIGNYNRSLTEMNSGSLKRTKNTLSNMTFLMF